MSAFVFYKDVLLLGALLEYFGVESLEAKSLWA